jgi:molybdopterin synthase catalytic subunit
MIMQLQIAITEDEISPADLLGNFVRDCDGAGAIVSFCGIARSMGARGTRVATLRLEHHPRLTEPSLERIAREATERFHITDAIVVHRYGPIEPKEVIVFVATASPHRRAAFLAADYLMDRLKTDAVLWKKEEGIDGGRWIEPTEEDRAAVARWE